VEADLGKAVREQKQSIPKYLGVDAFSKCEQALKNSPKMAVLDRPRLKRAKCWAFNQNCIYSIVKDNIMLWLEHCLPSGLLIPSPDFQGV